MEDVFWNDENLNSILKGEWTEINKGIYKGLWSKPIILNTGDTKYIILKVLSKNKTGQAKCEIVTSVDNPIVCM